MARTKITPVFLSLILCFIAALVIVQSKFNTASAVEMIAPVLILVAVKTLDLLYLTMWEYLALLSLLIIEMLKIPPVNTSLFLIFFLVDLCLIIFFHYKKFNSNGLNISITVILCTVIYIGFSLIRVKFIGHLYTLISEYNWNTYVKMTFIFLYGLLCAGITCIITLMTKKIINIKRPSLDNFMSKYQELENSILLLLAFTLFVLAGFEILIPFKTFSPLLQPIWAGILFLVLLTQAAYIRLLFKTAALKEKMARSESNRQALMIYNNDLENNLDELRAVKHDVKNLFLTMGGFVDTSNDEDMKRFYKKNIIPFVQDTLQKSDLYIKLKCISDEALKSFLYYKIIQGMSCGVPFELDIHLDHGDIMFTMEQSDLIRLLGILLDNAIEEAKRADCNVGFRISEDESKYHFTVRNGTRRETQIRGITAGTTDKGLGRGNGLLIARRIISKYKNIVLNSYFQGEEFVQQLIIDKN